MLFRFRILLAILFSVTVAAHGDDASKAAKVQEFFKVAKLDQLSAQIMRQTMDQVNAGMMQQMYGVKLQPDQQQRMKEFSEKVSGVISDALGWQKLEPEYIRMYSAAFTEQQMDEILAFYKSPTGQAMVEKNPVLLKQSSAIVQERLAIAMPEVQKLTKDFIAEEAKKERQSTQ